MRSALQAIRGALHGGECGLEARHCAFLGKSHAADEALVLVGVPLVLTKRHPHHRKPLGWRQVGDLALAATAVGIKRLPNETSEIAM